MCELPSVTSVVQDLADSEGVNARLVQGVWHLELTEEALVSLVFEQRRLAREAALAEANSAPEPEVDEFPRDEDLDAALEEFAEPDPRTGAEASGCAWCGAPLEINPLGRHRRYCSRAHRQRAYEVRTALARREADRAAGKISSDA
ncbi:hypothetical protein [Nocardiopsis sp. NPDC057823]|uniref:hypothetical protein n=1 Tax=Nocardiopsis sp. NPDC057823 TaxID=3346256 RepID=UPI0036704AAE